MLAREGQGERIWEEEIFVRGSRYAKREDSKGLVELCQSWCFWTFGSEQHLREQKISGAGHAVSCKCKGHSLRITVNFNEL
jgi:hypothetical protein